MQGSAPRPNRKAKQGERIADVLQTQSPAQNVGAKFPPISSISGCGLFCSGVNNLRATVPPSSSSSEASTIATLGGLTPNSYTATGMQQLLSFDNGLLLVQGGSAEWRQLRQDIDRIAAVQLHPDGLSG
jgi:hypothetical protein